ncbi:Gfo/Idh/MocA family protein [Virgibacillus kekensis]|uniref:Gfo/Idh/MocA family protein n=1 Tax=Virgibacillus kekensis TaxID=202261 RepID=A0ABV9DGV9_9BACI
MKKFAIVGCGRIAKKHAEAISNASESELFALCDLNEERLNELADLHNVKELYSSYEEMLKNPEIEVVNICTPNALHADMAVQAAEKGKHVMIEKPMATTIEDANRIIKAAKKNNVKAASVHQNRFNEAVQKTRKAYEEGKFGKMSHGVASIRWNRNESYYGLDDWRGTVKMQDGVLMNQCIHNIDLLIWMMGSVKKVTGITKTRFRDIEMEDVGGAILEFESGAIGIIEGAGTVYPTNLEETLNLFGETGTVCIGGIAVNRIENWRFSQDFQQEEQEIIKSQEQDPPSVYGYGHQLIVEDFVDAIENNKQPYVTLEDGKNAVEVVLAIYESSRTGNPVIL